MGQSQSYDLSSTATATPPKEQEHAPGVGSATKCTKLTHQDEPITVTETLARTKPPQEIPLKTHHDEEKAAGGDA
ncbi:hypothetical protein AB6A40_004000 [Gnathostoma spinigerum]|uniref:Uncharacterized protein n=1 Tax=Gnathostoma spinigerum TaxID=75299 RepID=A0ABD6EIS3_9BILA